ncbi:hypothetical protein [Falsiroseomonas stagni]|uniref:hypothetical protein n=1 Tax=Falsiroseomonas stagni TaxID=484882 RepID=UPI001587B504|nr:hypothetical protein [Falsiroseomonas stagni]
MSVSTRPRTTVGDMMTRLASVTSSELAGTIQPLFMPKSRLTWSELNAPLATLAQVVVIHATTRRLQAAVDGAEMSLRPGTGVVSAPLLLASFVMHTPSQRM